MGFQLQLTNRLAITAAVTLAVGAQLAWDHYHGGVPVHYMLHNKDLPAISNWWSLLILPLLTWVVLYLMHRGVSKLEPSDQGKATQRALKRCLIALVYGAAVGLAFTQGYTQISDALFYGLLVIALFIPLYKPEFLLGFVAGITYFIGAFLPTFFGLILVGVTFVLYSLGRGVKKLIRA